MPVVALPGFNTPRLFLDYTVGGEDHTVQFRYPEGGSQGAAVSTVVELMAFLDGSLYTTTINSLQFSDVESDVRNPITWPGDPSYGTGGVPAGQEMKFFSITGKDDDGHRCRVEMFGIGQAIPTTWRLALGVNTPMDNWFTHLRAAYLDGTFCSIAGRPVVWNLYYNFKYADHEIAKARG